MFGIPVCSAVCEGFAEYDSGTCWSLGDDDVRRVVRGVVEFSGHTEIALVATGNATESAVIGSGVCQVPGDDDESLGEFERFEREILFLYCARYG